MADEPLSESLSETLSASGAPAAVRLRGASSSARSSARQATPESFFRSLSQRHLLVPLTVGLALVVFIILLFGGYAWGWKWTGFKENSLWDWFSLLTTPFAITAIGWAISWHQAQNSKTMSVLAHQETILDTYLTDLSRLLLDQHLRESPPESPLRDAARASTRAAAQRVGANQRQVMLRFLRDFGLLAGSTPLLTPEQVSEIFADVSVPAS